MYLKSRKELQVIVILILTIQTTLAPVGCRMACKKCKMATDDPSVVQVYCEMCDECKLKRQERMKMKRIQRENQFNHENTEVYLDSEQQTTQTYPEGCPTPPPCESEEMQAVSKTFSTTTILTTTTTTTTRPTCPPIRPCKKKLIFKTTTTSSCMSCSPKCPCPMFPFIPMGVPVMPVIPMPVMQSMQSVSVSPIALKATEQPTKSTTDYLYVFVGVPRHLLNR